MKIIQIISIYIGIIFGGGFASGQELISFFLRFGHIGIAGIGLSAAVIGLCAWAICDICVRFGIKSYKGFMELVFGRRLGFILEIITSLFIFTIFSAMFAGIGALAQETFGINFSIGVLVMGAIIFIMLNQDSQGIVKINTIISPILVILAVSISIYIIFSDNRSVLPSSTSYYSGFWFISAFIYASYNMLTAFPALSSINIINTRKMAFLGALFGGLAIGVLGIILGIVLLSYYPLVYEYQLPLLAVSTVYGGLVRYAFLVLLFLAVLTTCLINGFSTLKYLKSRTSFKESEIRIFIVLLAIFAAHIGFSYIVNYVYAFFGYLGSFIALAVVLFAFKKTS